MSENLLLCAKIGFAANPTADVTSFNKIRVCSGKGIFYRENLFEENVQEERPGNCQEFGNIPGKKFGEKMTGSHARLQVCTYSGYDL